MRQTIQPPVTLHVHTAWSDGTASVAAMAQAAAAKGFNVMGVSDHWVPLPDGGNYAFALPADRFDDYVRAVRAPATASEVEIRLGVEIDYFPGTEAAIRDLLRRADFDFVIGSVHFLDRFSLDTTARDWEGLSLRQIDELHREYWLTLRRMVETGLFDFVGHLDLPKKFGFLPRHEPEREIGAALDAIAATGVPIEINTAGWDKPCAEAYPAPALLRECCRRGIPALISDDAHAPADLGRHFARAVEQIKAAGWTRVLTFKQRRRCDMPL